MVGIELSIVLPCYNESRNLPLILDRLRAFAGRYGFELILVDNGSTDDSAAVLRALLAKEENRFARSVRIERNIGYGHGIMTGLDAANGKVLAYSHADIQTPPEDVFRAFQLMKDNHLALDRVLIKGLRVNRREDQQVLTRALGEISSLLLGYELEDINGQPKLFSRGFLASLKGAPVDFSFDVFVMYKAKQQGLAIKTFPVDFGTRLHGESKWANSLFSKYRTIFGYLRNICFLALQNIKDQNNPFQQFSKFILVGGLNTAITYAAFYALYKYFAFYYVLASTIGYLMGMVSGFYFNRRWTFRADGGGAAGQLLKYFILNLISLGTNVLAIYALTESFSIIPEVSQLIVLVLTTLINYSGAKWWVFKR
ncbi:MAG: bifunctional glycosyltransferase family 2/GtrA family protein [Candidatus Margulisbacteria bacterium]|nr:bifunctional glycosyltransferase family 2/GtrA family protein [Candidatus Margulisiibacteriota bacterium]